MSEVFVSPDGGSRMRVASPAAVVRMRARGWRPESESESARSARKPAAPKSAPKSES